LNCKYFGECGSCKNYEDGYDAQLLRKINSNKERFRNFYDDEFDICRSQESGYRARAEFKIWHIGDEIRYAMNASEHKGVLIIDECPQVNEHIFTLMPKLILEISEANLGHKLFGADFLSSSDGDIVVSLLYHKQLNSEWEEKAKVIAQKLGVSLIGRSRKQKLVIGKDYVQETLHPKGTSHVSAKEYKFIHIENSFTQPNPKVNEQMIAWALEQFEDANGDLLELYCGAGNFTIPLACKFDKVLATEISKSSISAAKNNMQLNDVANIEFVRMSAEEFVQALDGEREFNRMKEIDITSYKLKNIFVDPPRSGMDEESCAFAARHESILYISCNPETLHRDLEILTKTHTIQRMALFDQFPYTNHVEMGVKLIKKS
jgi:tRNA (uracil-5-)-methyltransferase